MDDLITRRGDIARQWRAWLENNFVFVCVFSPDGKLIAANPAALAAAGVLAEEVVGRHLTEIRSRRTPSSSRLRMRVAESSTPDRRPNRPHLSSSWVSRGERLQGLRQMSAAQKRSAESSHVRRQRKALRVVGALLARTPSAGICDRYFRCAAAMIVKVVDGKVESIESESGDHRPDGH